jgi:hypothetical protein
MLKWVNRLLVLIILSIAISAVPLLAHFLLGYGMTMYWIAKDEGETK